MAFLLVAGGVPFQAFAADTSAQDDASVAFEVRLEIEGDTPEEDIPFTFILDAPEGTPVPADCYATRHGAGIAEFEEIEFTEPGEYKYTITQRNDEVVNYTYDTSIYTLDVQVKYDNDEQLVATYSVSSDDAKGTKQPELVFVNEYEDNPVSDNPAPSDNPTPSDEPTPSDTPSNTPSDGTTSSDTPGTSVTNKTITSTTPSTLSTNSTTNKTSTSGSTSTPKTGDDTNTLPWIVLLCAVVIGILDCLRYLISTVKRNHKHDS
jgi:pilin isopeptide linkage protein